MNKGLKIFACSGLGDNTGSKIGFQTEDTVAVENTRAMNSMLAKVNLFATRIRRLKISTIDLVKEYNNLTFYFVCFYYARLYRNEPEVLKALASPIAAAYNTGMFLSTSIDPEERNAMVDDIIAKIDDMLESGQYTTVGDVYNWWMETIVKQNVVGLPEDVREYVSGIGATIRKDYGELNKYLYDGGTYFLYLFMTEKQLSKSTYAIRKRRRKQEEVYDYCRKCFCYEYGGIYGNEQDMVNVITAGIIEDFGATPEEVVTDILQGNKKNGIGVLDPITIAAIISAVVSLVLGLINAICNYAAQVAVAKYAMPEDIDDGMANEKDWEGLNGNETQSSISPIILGAAALGLLFMNKDKIKR